MIRRPPRSTRTYTLFPYTTLFRSTYFFHPHGGVQLDRGLYAPLIIDDPSEPGRYDAEWVVVLDDWIDGTGTTPDEVFTKLTGGQGGGLDHGSMEGMDHGAMRGMARDGAQPFGDAGDVASPHYVNNGRAPADPDVLRAKPGQRARMTDGRAERG